jgi:hypothetical protein
VRGIPPEKAWACLKTTQRYAHLSQYTLLAAANAATVAVGAVMLPVALKC